MRSIKPFGAKASPRFIFPFNTSLPHRIFLIFPASLCNSIFLVHFPVRASKIVARQRDVFARPEYISEKAARTRRQFRPFSLLCLPRVNSFFASLRCANVETGELCRVRSIRPTPGVSLKDGGLATQENREFARITQ